MKVTDRTCRIGVTLKDRHAVMVSLKNCWHWWEKPKPENYQKKKNTITRGFLINMALKMTWLDVFKEESEVEMWLLH